MFSRWHGMPTKQILLQPPGELFNCNSNWNSRIL